MNFNKYQNCSIKLLRAEDTDYFGDVLSFHLNFGERTINRSKLTNSLDWIYDEKNTRYKLVTCGLDKFDITDYAINFEGRVERFECYGRYIIPWSLMFEIIKRYDVNDRFGIEKYERLYHQEDSTKIIDVHANNILDDYYEILKEKPC